MSDDTEIYRMLGEMRGKLDAVVRSVDTMANQMTQLSKDMAVNNMLHGKVEDHEARIKAVERMLNRTEGRDGAWGSLLSSRLFGSIVTGLLAALGAAWLIVKGKFL